MYNEKDSIDSTHKNEKKSVPEIVSKKVNLHKNLHQMGGAHH